MNTCTQQNIALHASHAALAATPRARSIATTISRIALSLLALTLALRAQTPSNYEKIGFRGRPQNASAQSPGLPDNSLVSGAYTLRGYAQSEPGLGNLPRVGAKLLFRMSWHRFDEIFVTHNLTGASFYSLTPTENGAVAIPNAFEGREMIFGNPTILFPFTYWTRVTGELWWETGTEPATITSARSEMRDEVAMPNLPALAGMTLTYQPFAYSFTQSQWVCGDETIFVVAP